MIPSKISFRKFSPIKRQIHLILWLTILLTACQTQLSKELQQQQSQFEIDDIAKADIDMVADVTLTQSMNYLRSLARKLYRRNPHQLHRAQIDNIEYAVTRLFSYPWPSGLTELNGKRSVSAIQLAFNEEFQGDRVAALIAGLRDMLLDTYGGQSEFYLYSNFDPQKIYNLARNFEVSFWKLNHDRNKKGELFLLSNAINNQSVINLSFERLYGKLIALQDQMAIVIANSTNRHIKNIIQSAARMVFLPI